MFKCILLELYSLHMTYYDSHSMCAVLSAIIYNLNARLPGEYSTGNRVNIPLQFKHERIEKALSTVAHIIDDI